MLSAAVALPFVAAMSRATASAQWRADLSVVGGHMLVRLGEGGTLGMLLQQAMGLLPLGNAAFRASSASALALGISCGILFQIAHRLIEKTTLSARYAVVLATIATLTAGLSPSWQSEGTVGGSGLVIAIPVLWSIHLLMKLASEPAPSFSPRFLRDCTVLSALCGITLADNSVCGVALLVAIGLTAITARKFPPSRSWPVLFAILTATFLLWLLPSLLRQATTHRLADVGHALLHSLSDLSVLAAAPGRHDALIAWFQEVGYASLGLSALGLYRGLFRNSLRAWLCPIIVFVVFDRIYPAGTVQAFAPDRFAALHAIAFAALAIAAALGVAEAINQLCRMRIPMAHAAATMLAVVHVAMAAVTADDATFVADRSQHVAAEVWTDEALGQLPMHAAVLVHSPVLSWRLWAAQKVRLQRPDVLIVAAPLLDRGLVGIPIFQKEPATAQLLRDLALTGQASELGLTRLADARPLLVDLDERWQPRLIRHLTVAGPWLRFFPQTLGASDHKIVARHSLEKRIGRNLHDSTAPDGSTAAVVAQILKEHIAAISLVGMGEQVGDWLDGVERFAPDDPFVLGARLRLAHAKGHRGRPVELRDLLRY